MVLGAFLPRHTVGQSYTLYIFLKCIWVISTQDFLKKILHLASLIPLTFGSHKNILLRIMQNNLLQILILLHCPNQESFFLSFFFLTKPDSAGYPTWLQSTKEETELDPAALAYTTLPLTLEKT